MLPRLELTPGVEAGALAAATGFKNLRKRAAQWHSASSFSLRALGLGHQTAAPKLVKPCSALDLRRSNIVYEMGTYRV